MLDFNKLLHLHQEPGINVGKLVYLIESHAGAECVSQIPDAGGAGVLKLVLDMSLGIRILKVNDGIQTALPDFQSANGVLQGFLEVASDGHNLAYGLHLSGQTVIGLRELFKIKPGHLGDHIVQSGLEGSRGAISGNVIA